MATDSERRKAAAWLRSEIGNGHHWPGALTIAEAIGVPDPTGSGWEGRLLGRLADLIEPPYPDATASCKGWRAEVYDPDGVLVSPSNLAVDLVRAHEYGKGLGVDRDALLELADRMEHMAGMGALLSAHGLAMAAASIREACGEVEL